MKSLRVIIGLFTTAIWFFGTRFILEYGITSNFDQRHVTSAIVGLYVLLTIIVILFKLRFWQAVTSEAKFYSFGLASGVFLVWGFYLFSLSWSGYMDKLTTPATIKDVISLPGETVSFNVKSISVPEGCYMTTGRGYVLMEDKTIFPRPIELDYSHNREHWGNTIKSSSKKPGKNRINYTTVEYPVSLQIPKNIEIKKPVKMQGVAVMPLLYAKVRHNSKQFRNVSENIESKVHFWIFPNSLYNQVKKSRWFNSLFTILFITGIIWTYTGSFIVISIAITAVFKKKLKQIK